MPATSYFAKCFSCSAEVGKILHGRFLRHNCQNPLPQSNGRPQARLSQSPEAVTTTVPCMFWGWNAHT